MNEPLHQSTHNSLKTKRFNHSRHYTHIVHFVFVPVLGKEVPIRIDEILTLGKVSVTESEYTLFYQLNVEKDDFRQYELDNLIKETGEDMEFEFYYPTLSLCRMAGVNPTDFFKNSNIKFVCIFSDTNNEHIGLCEIDFKDFAGKQH